MVSAVSVLSAFSGWRAIEVEQEAEPVRSYIEELAYVEREDGIGLEGALIHPAAVESKDTAIIWVHGNTSRYYDLPYVQVGREMAALGYTFVTANTHGHDVMSELWDDNAASPAGAVCWEQVRRSAYGYYALDRPGDLRRSAEGRSSRAQLRGEQSSILPGREAGSSSAGHSVRVG